MKRSSHTHSHLRRGVGRASCELHAVAKRPGAAAPSGGACVRHADCHPQLDPRPTRAAQPRTHPSRTLLVQKLGGCGRSAIAQKAVANSAGLTACAPSRAKRSSTTCAAHGAHGPFMSSCGGWGGEGCKGQPGWWVGLRVGACSAGGVCAASAAAQWQPPGPTRLRQVVGGARIGDSGPHPPGGHVDHAHAAAHELHAQRVGQPAQRTL